MNALNLSHFLSKHDLDIKNRYGVDSKLKW